MADGSHALQGAPAPAAGHVAVESGRARELRRDLLAWAGLALATLATLWPLGLTNRVLAGVDAYTYFTPYWAYRMAELRAGHLPLWNPYLFLGVPFLANPQAAVLYPLHWPLSWLDPAQALIWSALLHVWLASCFTYAFARRSLHLTRPAAALAGLLFGLSGYTLARVENINQLNALAWLPAMLWAYDAAVRAKDRRPRLRWGAGLAVIMALAVLAGHTQSTFIDLAGLGLYGTGALILSLWRRRDGAAPVPGPRWHAWLLPFLAIVPAVLLAAAQLLPTLELNDLGLRTGGLPFRQAVSFSLRPRLLLQSLMPPLTGGLAETFGSEGYAEFAGWLGVTGLLLALAGARRSLAERRILPSNLGLLALAAVGFLLALGAYNPLYYLLWRFVPGFDLFRAPARWLALYSLGMAGLAGVGLDALLARNAGTSRMTWAIPGKWRRPALVLGALLLFALLAYQQYPRWAVIAGWLLAGTIAATLWSFGLRRGGGRETAGARAALIALALAELWLGARALPFTQATAPAAANGMRNAPATLLAQTAGQPPAGRDRFLSLSDIRFDPGDLAELRSLEADRLAADALDRFVRAAKQMEVIAPNLSLLLQLPAVDGYDGGVLPLDRYVKLQTLFLAPGAGLPAGSAPRTPLPDGRLREQLRQVPPDQLLDLTGTRYIITDKQNDLWAGDVYYDLEQAVTLQPGEELKLDLSTYPPFSATALGIVSYLANPLAQAGPVAALRMTNGSGETLALALDAPADTGWGQETTAQRGQTVARPWPDWMGQGEDFLAVKEFGGAAGCPSTIPAAARGVLPVCAFTPATLAVGALPDASGPLVLRGLTLIDRRTGAHQSITLSPHGDRKRIYSGDVKIYERSNAPGRAWLVHAVQAVADDSAALARLADPAFDPRQEVVITGTAPDLGEGTAAESANVDRVDVIGFEAERAVLRSTSGRPGLLVLADANYPGWSAAVDGQPAPILQANLLFRAVPVPAGTHEVTFTYQPANWPRGLAISLAALGLLVLALAWSLLPPRR